MNTLLELLCITLIVVFIVDLSGFVDNVKNAIRIIFNIKNDITLKPFDCSLCMTFWCCLIFLLVTSKFTLINILISCMLSYFTRFIGDLLESIQSLLFRLIIKITR